MNKDDETGQTGTPGIVLSSDQLGLAPQRWYCVSSGGLATLCNNEYDARAEVLSQAFNYPRAGPYSAMTLGDVSAERERMKDAIEAFPLWLGPQGKSELLAVLFWPNGALSGLP